MDEPTAQKPLEYEETPLIEPIVETPAQSPPQVPVQSPPKKPSFMKKFFGFIGNLIFFIVLFALGMWLSTVLRQFLPTGIEPQSPTQVSTPTPTIPIDPTALWIPYSIAGISYKLPPEVLAPVCDGASCTSMGTYMPGGTRFTVSARSTSLSYMQKAIITDAAGRAFTSSEATVSGSPAIEYNGSFRGTTTGGYTFTQMRGFMVGAGEAQTVEFNHFAPAGLTSDFAADDLLFNTILETVNLRVSQATSSATP